MNITVQVNEVTLASVIDERWEDGPYEQTVGGRVAFLIAEHVYKDDAYWPKFRDQIMTIRDEEIRAAITPLITEALTRELQQTNIYGEPAGTTTTLSEVIVAEARKQLKATPRDSYHNEQQSIVAKLVAAEVTAAFGNVITDEVAKARALVAGEIGQRVAAAVQAGLAKR